ncbi:MAG: carboxymuconolactone decarboxylase family protein [Acidobacteriota bacterium]
MSQFPVQSLETAPEASRATLEAAQKNYGFLPNLLGVMATSPALVEGYATLAGIFGKTSFSPTEQQVVLLATSGLNGCTYCMAAHSVIANMSKVPADVIEALRENRPLADAKLEALRQVTLAVVESRGWPSEEAVQSFYSAGYGPQQLLEVVLGVGLKTLSNYTNHVAQTPLDPAFQSAEWQTAS